MTYFEMQDVFLQRMIEDFNKGLISQTYRKYFDWKVGHIGRVNFSREDAYQMIEAAQEELEHYYDKYPDAYSNNDPIINDDPWRDYRGFGEDCYIVSYLEGISEELTNIMMIL